MDSTIGVFFDKLFPFQHLWPLGNESLTAWWVLGLLVYFVVSGVWLSWKWNAIRSKLQQAKAQPEETVISSLPKLQEDWAEYARSFIEVGNDQHKTHEEAIYYFNENSVLSRSLDLRYWYSVPNLLVGFGILGTFIGLAFGVSNFNTENTEAIKAGIKVLLSGMGLAFVTSIWGMFLSIGFNILEKRFFSSLNQNIHELCRVLDKKFKFSKHEEIQLKKSAEDEMMKRFEERQRALLESYFVFQNEAHEKILPAFILRDMLLQSEQQTKALKSFSTDLADGIVIANQTIEAMGKTFAEMIEEPFRTQFTPAIEKIEAAVNQMRKAKEESSGNMIQEVLGEVQAAIVQLGAEFQNSLSGTTHESLENLAQVVGQASNSLLSFPEQMDRVMGDMQSQSEQLKGRLESFSERILKTAEENANRLRNETESTAQGLQGVISSLQNKMQALLEQQAEGTKSVSQVIQNSQDVMKNGQNLIKEMKGTMYAFSQAYSQLNTLSSEMHITTNRLSQSSRSLEETSNRFESQAKEFLKGNQATLSQLESALNEAKMTAQDYSNRFQVIQSGLADIFGEVEQGLQRYQQTTREKLNDSLSSFSQQLSEAAKYLSSSISELQEVVEEVSEIRGRI